MSNIQNDDIDNSKKTNLPKNINNVRERLLSDTVVSKELREELASFLPKSMPVERFIKIANKELISNKKIWKCSSQSILDALLLCAQYQLVPGAVFEHCFLNAYGETCKLILGYKGMIKILYRNPLISSIEAHPVYEGEVFVVIRGTTTELRHVVTLDRNINRDDDNIIGAYAFVRLKNGEIIFEVTPKTEIDKIREKSSSKNGTAWEEFYGQMARKTAIRRLYKYIPFVDQSILEVLNEDEKLDYMDYEMIDGSTGEILNHTTQADKLALEIETIKGEYCNEEHI